MAAATMLLVCLRAASRRKRPDRRCWAVHARATTAGSRPWWRRASSTRPRGGAGRTRPTRPAGPAGGRCRPWCAGPGGPGCRCGYSPGTSPHKPMQVFALATRRPSATRRPGERAQPGHPRSAASRATCQSNGGCRDQPARSASTASGAWLRTWTTARSWPRSGSWPAGRTAGNPARPGRRGPGRPARHGLPCPTGTCRAGSAPGGGLGPCRRGAAQLPHRRLLEGGETDTGQLAGAVQPGQPAAVPPVGLDLVAGPSGISHGAITWQLPPTRHQPGQRKAGRAGLRAGSQPGRSGNRAMSLRTDASSWAIPSTSGPAGRLAGSQQRWCRCGPPGPDGSGQDARHWPRPAPSLWWLRPLSVGDPPRCGPEPAIPCRLADAICRPGTLPPRVRVGDEAARRGADHIEALAADLLPLLLKARSGA
jgi:hypothetical protein